MIRIIIAAVWICAVTAGSIYFAFTASSKKPEPDTEQAFFGGLDYVRSGMISVPVIKKGGIEGYFIARLVYTVEPEVKAKLSVPSEILLTDHLYTYIYGNPQLDFSNKETLDLDLLRSSIRDSINQRVGSALVHEVLVEQIDYMPKDSIRDNALRRRVAQEQKTLPHPSVP